MTRKIPEKIHNQIKNLPAFPGLYFMKDKAGTPLPYSPNDKRAEPVREELKGLLERATKMGILVGESTHKSQ